MLTPEQTSDLVEHFGSRRAAGRAIGVSAWSISYWLNPDFAERERARSANNYEHMTGLRYNRRLLLDRRYRALQRRSERSARGTLDGNATDV